MNQEKLLLEIKRRLEKLRLPFFLSCGTLLGAVRSGGFIDKDLDLGIMGSWRQEKQKIIDALTFDGLCKSKEYLFYKKQPVILGFVSEQYTVDIGFHYLEAGKIWKGINAGYLVVEEFNTKHFDAWNVIDFCGTKFIIPSYVEELLKHKYGEDWRVPDLHWHWQKLKSITKHIKNKDVEREVYA